MEHQPKISLIEAYLLVTFALIADLINWIPFLSWVVTVITLPAFQFYFFMKGVRGVWSLGGNIVEFIPGLSALPAVTAGVVDTILIDRAAATKLGQAGLAAAGPVGKLAGGKTGLLKKAA